MSKVFIEETTLSALGDAIREKTGKSELIAPLDMPNEIKGIVAGGGGDITQEDLTFSGNISYMFSNGNFLTLNEKVPFLLKDIERAERTFSNVPSGYDLSNITITTKDYSDVNDGAYVSNMFDSCKSSTLPTINGRVALLGQNLFNACRYITDDEVRKFLFNPNLEFAWCNTSSRTSNPGISNMFNYCISLRNINDVLLYIHQYFRDNLISYSSALNDYYYGAFYNCDALDEICNIPVFSFLKESPNTSNMLSNLCSYCGRAKNIMFATDNGVPYVKQWKSQTLDMSSRTGWANSSLSNFSGYSSGIRQEDEVKDDATYQALKNTDGWWTGKEAYSRYNHDSAVNTINSLPDTSAYLASAGGTNTIKFKGAAGSLTDGGAINTLTEEEIAVAAAKGWTVSFV